ncbi:MAG TPA: BrnT family toxin [Chakrabartia sp.]|nr:BrnT family toxin [Chakrabartia sp.]
MVIEFDETKRQRALAERGIDFADAARVFAGPRLTQEDDRFAYPEPCFQTYGLLDGRLMIVVWTPTENGIRVISMRKCNEREQARILPALGR